MMPTAINVFPTPLETSETTRTSVAGIVSPTVEDTLVLDPNLIEGNLLVPGWSTTSDSFSQLKRENTVKWRHGVH
jgi:hypothetical protein